MKRLPLNTEKVETVRRVFEISDDNPTWSFARIAANFSEEGHATAQRASFLKVQVKRIIDRREFYEGRYEYGGVETLGQHTAIL